MAKSICLFNHKGGVGKTTLTYNLGWMLAEKQQRVLMIDADPQCNLTEFCIGTEKLEKDILDGNIKNTIYDIFISIIEHSSKSSSAEKKDDFYNIRENLDLIAGSIHFAELDTDIGFGIKRITRGFEDVLPSIYKRLSEIGNRYDYIIIDLSPSLNPTNQLFLMFSDYFITPVFPGIFSLQALRNLGTIFRNWNRDFGSFEKRKLPKFLGIVFQNFRPYTKPDEKSAMRFAEAKKQLNDETFRLAHDLNGFGMAISPDEFQNVFVDKIPYTIAEISDINQLKVIAENEGVPVVALTNKILNRYKLGTPQYILQRDELIKIHTDIADSLIKL